MTEKRTIAITIVICKDCRTEINVEEDNFSICPTCEASLCESCAVIVEEREDLYCMEHAEEEEYEKGALKTQKAVIEHITAVEYTVPLIKEYMNETLHQSAVFDLMGDLAESYLGDFVCEEERDRAKNDLDTCFKGIVEDLILYLKNSN